MRSANFLGLSARSIACAAFQSFRAVRAHASSSTSRRLSFAASTASRKSGRFCCHSKNVERPTPTRLHASSVVSPIAMASQSFAFTVSL